MTWTYAQVKAADPGGDLATAASALNAQTTMVTVDVPVGTLYGSLLLSGVWGAMSAWAAANPADKTGALGVIHALQAMLTSPNIATVEMTNPATKAAVTGMLQTLVSVNVITASQQTEMLSLASQTVPVWQPAITTADIQIARAQP